MEIKKTENEDVFQVLFSGNDLLLFRDVLANTYSGADTWRVPPESFMGEFGITYDRVVEIDDALAEMIKSNKISSATFTRQELRAIKMMLGRLIELWDEGDFSTMIATDKLKAKLLQEQLFDFSPPPINPTS